MKYSLYAGVKYKLFFVSCPLTLVLFGLWYSNINHENMVNLTPNLYGNTDIKWTLHFFF